MDLTLVLDELEKYVRKEFLEGDESAELTPATPLLEWGILNSLNTARLTAFVNDRFDVNVPPRETTLENFRNLECVGKLVLRLHAQPTP